jgi:hypothetical protein
VTPEPPHNLWGHDDHHDQHEHIQLQYQPAMPMTNGKLIVWLFLSTEIMFFAALIGAYIVIRFGAPPGTWPTPHDVHVKEWIGALNTFVLICSSVTIVLALEMARANKYALAKLWVFVTFALGCVYLGWKAYEYGSKFDHVIYPSRPSLVYEKPDLYYVSAARIRLDEIMTGISAQHSEEEALERERAQLQRDQEQLPAEIEELERELAEQQRSGQQDQVQELRQRISDRQQRLREVRVACRASSVI